MNLTDASRELQAQSSRLAAGMKNAAGEIEASLRQLAGHLRELIPEADAAVRRAQPADPALPGAHARPMSMPAQSDAPPLRRAPTPVSRDIHRETTVRVSLQSLTASAARNEAGILLNGAMDARRPARGATAVLHSEKPATERTQLAVLEAVRSLGQSAAQPAPAVLA